MRHPSGIKLAAALSLAVIASTSAAISRGPQEHAFLLDIWRNNCLSSIEAVIATPPIPMLNRYGEFSKDALCTCAVDKMRADKQLRPTLFLTGDQAVQYINRPGFREYVVGKMVSAYFSCISSELERAVGRIPLTGG